ncbi:hypothetical protein MDOR_21980 [Mycolicibacterium doricum]|uniref:Uncharacterized protein n=1 Tax=Mycolicibacterium doricum TaxID=126673 RepID=A0A7I7VRW7_9MYCO|nr:hypothetical protein MDOR_21980 [Mycolicibacterium doricum]
MRRRPLGSFAGYGGYGCCGSHAGRSFLNAPLSGSLRLRVNYRERRGVLTRPLQACKRRRGFDRFASTR